MSIPKLPETQKAPSGTELMDKAKKALTPEQYARMEKKTLEKMSTMELVSMDLDKLKAELPKIVAWDHEEADIMERLEREFPGIKSTPAPAPKTELGFWDSTKKAVSDVGDWMYDALVPDRFKQARETAKKWGSTSAVVVTAALWQSAGNAVQTAEKALSWLDSLKKDPIAWFKELFSVLFSGDFKKIRAFFSSGMDALGISTEMVESFVEKMWVPKALLKTAKSLFSDDKFTKMSYGSVEKIWQDYQKNPSLDVVGKLGVLWGREKEVLPILEQLFSKDSKALTHELLKKWSNVADIAWLPMSDIIKQLAL
jgi:hypothetical protein